MKVALIADTHVGIRNDNPALNEHFIKFHTEQFIPYLLENNITTIIHAGDVFDRRKNINFQTLHQWRTQVFDVIKENNIEMHIIAGNHDVYYKNTNKINALDEILRNQYPNIHTYTSTPHLLKFPDGDILLVPWVTDDNIETVKDALNKAPARLCIGHFDIVGFEMYAGHKNSDKGFLSDNFVKFNGVYSGHYHHKSNQGEIHYLGSPYQMMWSDADDPRGFHILDIDNEELEFIPNKDKMFYHVVYDGNNIIEPDYKTFAQKYVKILAKNKTSSENFEYFLSKVYEQNPVDVSIVEGDLVDVYVDEETDTSMKNTKDILLDYIEELTIANKAELKTLMQELYIEAVNLDNSTTD